MLSRTATCACGQLRLACQGEPVRISMCHCYDCQRRTGSIFGVQARYEEKNVSISGKDKIFVRTGDSGGKVTFHFCPECGSTVYWRPEGLEGFWSVAVGNFADNTFPSPTVSVYHETRKHKWVGFPGLNPEIRG